MTLNDYFALNSVFAPVWLAPNVRFSKNNSTKTNNDRHILSVAKIFGRDSSFQQYKACVDIHSGSLGKEDVKGQWGRALTLVLNVFSWLSKTIVLRKIKSIIVPCYSSCHVV